MTKKQTKAELIRSLTESLKNPNLSARDRAPLSRLLAKLSDLNIDAPITELRKRKKEAAAAKAQAAVIIERSADSSAFEMEEYRRRGLPVEECGAVLCPDGSLKPPDVEITADERWQAWLGWERLKENEDRIRLLEEIRASTGKPWLEQSEEEKLVWLGKFNLLRKFHTHGCGFDYEEFSRQCGFEGSPNSEGTRWVYSYEKFRLASVADRAQRIKQYWERFHREAAQLAPDQWDYATGMCHGRYVDITEFVRIGKSAPTSASR